MEAHGAVGILLLNGPHRPVIDRGHIDPGRGHQPSTKGQALGAVVVAADEIHGADFCQPGEKIVKALHRLGRGDGFVVNIAAEEGRVDPLLPGHRQDLLQNKALVLQHGKAVDPLAQMQIGKMHQFHIIRSPSGQRCPGTPWPRRRSPSDIRGRRGCAARPCPAGP